MFRKPIINTIVQVAGKAVMVAMGLVTTGLLTRKLGAEIYGAFALTTAVFIFLDSLADFGTKIIGVRELSKNRGKLAEIVVLRLIMSGVAFGAGLFLIWGWSGFAGLRAEAVVALTMIWFTSLAGSLEIVWQAEMRMEKKVLVEIVFLLLFLVGLVTWNREISLMWVFSMYLVARIISLGIGLKIFNFQFLISKIDEKFWNGVRGVFKMSWPMGLYLLVFSAYDRAIDSMMIQRFLGLKEVAWYGLAYKIYAVLLQPAYFFVSSLFPLLSVKIGKENKQLYKVATMILGVGGLVMMVVVWLLAPIMVEILAGSGFSPSVEILRILLMAMVFSYFGHLVGFGLIAKGEQGIMLKLGLMVMVFNFMANLWAIPRFGIVGAAWVTVITEAISVLMTGIRLRTSK